MTTEIEAAPFGTDQALVDALVLERLPRQGDWNDEYYLWLTDDSNQLIELVNGKIEVLPMPTDRHQTILQYLFLQFLAFVNKHGGKVQFAPIRLRIREGNFREPDLLLVRDAADPRRQNRFWLGADLVLEVVSPDQPARDLVVKREEYAIAQISEYWIVDPQTESVTVLRLDDETYAEHGVFGRIEIASSALLDGFLIDVAAVFDAD